MKNEMNKVEYKNIELLRYYLTEQLVEINDKLTGNSDELVGYFIASVVDVLIVMIFNDELKILSFGNKVLVAIGLLILVWVVANFFKKIRYRKKESFVTSGKIRYSANNIQRNIDKFDNIACDGILMCLDYMEMYEMLRKKQYKCKNQNKIKDELMIFYFYEVLHHLKKAKKIYDQIAQSELYRELYVKGEKKDKSNKGLEIERIDNYRIINFEKMSDYIIDFLKEELKNNKNLDNIQLKEDIEKL